MGFIGTFWFGGELERWLVFVTKKKLPFQGRSGGCPHSAKSLREGHWGCCAQAPFLPPFPQLSTTPSCLLQSLEGNRQCGISEFPRGAGVHGGVCQDSSSLRI